MRLVADALNAYHKGEDTELAYMGSLIIADQYMCLRDLRTYIKGYMGIK